MRPLGKQLLVLLAAMACVLLLAIKLWTLAGQRGTDQLTARMAALEARMAALEAGPPPRARLFRQALDELLTPETRPTKPAVPQPVAAPQLEAKSPVVKPSKVLYGIETCSSPHFEAIMEAGLQSWAAGLDRRNLIISGGKYDDANHGLAASHKLAHCDDTQDGLWCSEMTVLWRAASDRVFTTGADWLMVLQEDKYVWPDLIEKELGRFDSSEPMVLAWYGCGRSWEHAPESKNNTIPKPESWAQPGFTCDAVWKHGAPCGGVGYFVSRGLLTQLLQPFETLEHFLKSAADRFDVTRYGSMSDVISACLFHERFPDARWRVKEVDRLTDKWNERSGFISTGTAGAMTGGHRLVPRCKGSVSPDELKLVPDRKFFAIHLNMPKEGIAQYIRDVYDCDRSAKGLTFVKMGMDDYNEWADGHDRYRMSGK